MQGKKLFLHLERAASAISTVRVVASAVIPSRRIASTKGAHAVVSLVRRVLIRFVSQKLADVIVTRHNSAFSCTSRIRSALFLTVLSRHIVSSRLMVKVLAKPVALAIA